MTRMIDLLKTATVFQGASPYEVSAYVKRHIGNHSISLRSESTRATLRYKNFGVLGVSQITYGSSVCVRSPGLDDSYHLQLVADGACRVRHRDTDIELTPGWGILINPREAVDLDYSPDCLKMIIKVPAALINRCSVEQFGQATPGGVQFRHEGFLLGQESCFFRMLELLYLEADQHAVSDRLITTPLGVLLATKLLEMVPHNAEPLLAGADDAAFLRIIDRHISAYPRDDISAEQLALECNVSVRTLYDRFKKAKGTTPSAYVKNRRLQRVHHDIQTRANGVRNVTEVALEYGFSHLGRFSAEYKNLFGELPSETLRRRRDQSQIISGS